VRCFIKRTVTSVRCLTQPFIAYSGRMLKRTYEGQNCSIARALELVGERWTLLIVRDALLGLRRFDEFQQSLGLARNVLTDRLNRLVDNEILKRYNYSDRPPRFEYRLTRKGRDLAVPLLALMQWGDRHVSPRAPRIARRSSDHRRVRAALVASDDTLVSPAAIELTAGPGLAAAVRPATVSR
jgi:DNA-binding HxlR family transcriptional regulator